jgi:maltose alpha-D-glucosyltransferase/alpha-amylase
VEYFGDPDVGGDECHMAFHFPLMPRSSWPCGGRTGSRSRRSWPRRRDPVGCAVGHLPAQPRRADPGDGQPTRNATTCTRSTPRTRG